MLSCVFLAGSLFLSDSTTLYNIDQVLEVSLARRGTHLHLDQGPHRSAIIPISDDLRSDTPLGVITACVDKAGPDLAVPKPNSG